MLNDVLIGYDVREMYLPETDPWPDAPRRNSFLRRDIEKVFSMNRFIWPSIFRPNIMIIGGAPMPDIPNIEIPILQNKIHNLWCDLEEMRAEITNKSEIIPKPCWVIAVTEGMDDEDKAQWQHPPHPHVPYPFVPREIDPEWLFLGYDVIYDRQWSALSGVRFSADEIGDLREKWGEHLNEHHLFVQQEQALQYAEWADLDPGHAPHLVYGMYLIERLDVV